MQHEAPANGPRVPLAHHFGNFAIQTHSVRFGMWLFLATEVLLFAGLFLGYAEYRFLYHDGFAAASRHLDLTLGAVNTVVLITSSFFVAMGIHFTRVEKPRLATLMLVLTILCALAFLGIKAVEYHQKFEEGFLPGKFFAPVTPELLVPGASMYFSIYFFSTGLHALHVIIGMCVLIWATVHTVRGRFSRHYYYPVELSGLYWHLVDLIWIFLFPLLYLI